MNKQLQFNRAALTWKILIECAKKNELITYKKLGEKIKAHHRVVRYPLDLIQKYCIKHDLPPLSILVIDRNGNRGQGFIKQGDLKVLERKVKSFNWITISNPFLDKLIINKKYCNLSKAIQISNENIVNELFLQTSDLPSYLFVNKKRIINQPDQFINLASEKYNNREYKRFEIINEYFITFPNWKENPIQRNEVIQLFKENKKYLGFISAMIWGGINSSRPKEKAIFETIDFYRLLKMDRKLIEKIIENVENFLIKDDIKDCFIYLKTEGKINGIDYPYFTKLMYFIGQSNIKIKTKPLIFDKWTSNAYLALLINSNNLKSINNYYTGRVDKERKLVGIRKNIQEVYESYVNDMKKWSNQINITPSKLEEFIFGISLKIDNSAENPRNQLWNIILKAEEIKLWEEIKKMKLK